MVESAGKMGGGANAPSGSSTPSGSGKNYTDFGEAGQALKHLDDAFDALTDAWHKGEQMEANKGPGRDPANTSFSGVAKSQAVQHRKDILGQQKEIRQIRETLHAHLESQRRTEETNAANQKKILG